MTPDVGCLRGIAVLISLASSMNWVRQFSVHNFYESTALAMPIFTARKVFSSSLVISAASVKETGTTVWSAAP